MIELLRGHLAKERAAFDAADRSLVALTPYLDGPDLPRVSEDALALPLEIPALLAELSGTIRAESTSTATRALAGAIYSYVFNPFDYMPDDIGYLGFVDDAMIAVYGMRGLETSNPDLRFSTLHSEMVTRAMDEWESVLKQEVVDALTAHVEQVAGILGTATLPGGA